VSDTTEEGSGNTPFNFVLVPTHRPETLLEHVRSAVARGLPEVIRCEPHDAILSVAGGGPSLEDTYKELTGCIAAINGTLGYLEARGVKANICGVCDPSEHMAERVEAISDVTYFIASCCHPALFDKLLNAGCKVYLWHHHPMEGMDELLNELYPNGWVQIPGGCTMGLCWITLGYHLGFRKFHLHGLDSSFRETTHAYPDPQDHKEWIGFDGFKTRLNFLGQVTDFIGLMEDGLGPHVEPVEIKMFGEGLLQTRYRRWLKDANPW
jgi:hypothetical protein